MPVFAQCQFFAQCAYDDNFIANLTEPNLTCARARKPNPAGLPNPVGLRRRAYDERALGENGIRQT